MIVEALSTLGGGLLGGVMRFAPEVLKFFSSKRDQAHELAMLDREMQFATLRGEQEMRRADAAMSIAELAAMGEALKEQGETARSAGWFVAALSALVRPIVTYWFVILFSTVKIVGMSMAIDAGSDWKEVVLQSWTVEDMSMFSMIISFWFVSRSISK
tara:strand:+ start:59 stop:532 length:474 start_codon:yes stop_codon:yes gene_type:complete